MGVIGGGSPVVPAGVGGLVICDDSAEPGDGALESVDEMGRDLAESGGLGGEREREVRAREALVAFGDGALGAMQGEGVVPTFFELVDRSWAHLDEDLQLATKLGIDSEAFRRSLADHVGVGIDATMAK